LSTYAAELQLEDEVQESVGELGTQGLLDVQLDALEELVRVL
jgi:hypothetical protein